MIALLRNRPLRLKLGGLGLALAAGLVLGGGEDDVPAPANPSPAPRPAAERPVQVAAVVPSLALDRLRRPGPGASEVNDLFGSRSWAPPPPPAPPPAAAAPAPAPVVVAPPAPTAPPLPFTYIGRFQEEGQPMVYYLERGADVLVVAAGQQIDNNYRLEAAANGQLQFTYVPLDARQVLSIGEPK